jgi:LysM repeat protein
LCNKAVLTGYVVKKDTLEKIAKSNATTVNRIIEDNNIQDKNKIKVGQILFLV